MLPRLVVLVSGYGSNLQAIIDACLIDTIPAEIVAVISNNPDAFALQRAMLVGIPYHSVIWDKKTQSRAVYGAELATLVESYRPTLIVLAGFMHILAPSFLHKFSNDQIINLHPALPGQFPGASAIEDAYNANVPTTGAMVHTVVEEIDAGVCISKIEIPRFPNDSLQSLKDRINAAEKVLLVNAICTQLQTLLTNEEDYVKRNTPRFVKSGKVRDIYDMGCGLYLLEATDRCSCFDRQICKIPNKGKIINNISAWWFEQTRHIIPNHLVHAFKDEFSVSIVKRCTIFPIEFVVRGYITGTTNTAMWELYRKGIRVFGDVVVGDGLHKNQQLSEPIVTPTTKSDEHDEPLDRAEIVEKGYMTIDQYNYCHDIAIRLFKCGQLISAEHGLILVDTKYEFGIDAQGHIILADEIHTCDSSRFWKLETYEDKFDAGLEPDRFDKDMIRLYVKNNCDPYDMTQPIPQIPSAIIDEVSGVYESFYERLTGEEIGKMNFPTNHINLSVIQTTYFNEYHNETVVVINTGKTKQEKFKMRLNMMLNFNHKIHVRTEHHNITRSPMKLLEMLEKDQLNANRKRIIYVIFGDKKDICSATCTIVTNHTRYPVINGYGLKGPGEATLFADSLSRMIRI